MAKITSRLVSPNLQIPLKNSESAEDRVINLEEVSWHDNITDCWIIIYDRVYEVTDFLDEVLHI